MKMRGVGRLYTTLIGFVVVGAAAVLSSSAAADERKTCETRSGDVAILASTRAIATGKFKGKDLAVIHFTRGNAYYDKKNYNCAIADYDEAIRLDPDHEVAFKNRANASRRQQGLRPRDRRSKSGPARSE
jgi:tetratricopeptide (TPR) repeat protein